MMELAAREILVDLGEMSRLVLSDVGATLQILRLAANEHDFSDGRPARIEDCIAELGLQSCLNAMAQQPILSDDRHGAVLEMWAHCAEIARYSRVIAEEIDDGVHPEEAYLVGLCHTLGLLPAALGWEGRVPPMKDWANAGLKIAKRWRLPVCVQEFFAGMESPGSESQWAAIVRRAHSLATPSSIRCPLCGDPVQNLLSP